MRNVIKFILLTVHTVPFDVALPMEEYNNTEKLCSNVDYRVWLHQSVPTQARWDDSLLVIVQIKVVSLTVYKILSHLDSGQNKIFLKPLVVWKHQYFVACRGRVGKKHMTLVFWSAKCWFESRSWHVCPWARHLTILPASLGWDVKQ